MNTYTAMKAAIATTALALAGTAQAGGPDGTVTFDDAYIWFGSGINDIEASGLSTFYSGIGMTMSASETLFLGDGVSNTDDGNFDIEGTNGPAYLTFYNSAPGGTLTFSFENTVDFLVDLITSGVLGTETVECTVTTMRRGILVNTQIITLETPFGDPDGQANFFRFKGGDTFQFQLSPSSSRILAFDYIDWFNVGCGMADVNDDGFIDFFDISAYLNQYSAGCN